MRNGRADAASVGVLVVGTYQLRVPSVPAVRNLRPIRVAQGESSRPFSLSLCVSKISVTTNTQEV
jgi:hypothetical protein